MLWLFGSPQFLQGQSNCNLTIQGSVLDEHNLEPLMLANIFVEELGTGTTTDSLGGFSLSNLCPGKYILKISHLGCEPIIVSLTITKSVEKIFYLEHHAHLLKELAVSASKERVNATVNLTKIEGKELLKVSGKPLGEQLKGQMGISSVKTGNSISKPMIRGMYGSRVLILNNSLRLEGQQWGQEHAPEIDPFQAQSIKVIKGASSIRYGHDAMGGVILMEPGSLPHTHGIGGKVFLVGESNNGAGSIASLVEGKFDGKLPLSWRVGLTGKKAGNTRAPKYYLKNTGSEELDYNAALGYYSEKADVNVSFLSFQSRLGIFSATHFGNLTDLKNAFEAKVPLEVEGFNYDFKRPYQQVSHQSVMAKSIWRNNSLGNFALNYGWQRNEREEYDKEHGIASGSSRPEQQFEIFTNSTELIWTYSKLRNITIDLGATGAIQDNNVRGKYFIPAYENKSAGGFLIQQWEQGKWKAEGGIRYDYKIFDYHHWNQKLKTRQDINKKFSDFSWSFGLKYNPISYLNFYLNHGKAWRPPAVNELFSSGIHHGAASIEFGDTSMSKEIVYFESLGLLFDFGKWEINTEVFYSGFNGFIYLYPTGEMLLTIRGAFPVFEFRQAKVSTYGWEGKITRELPANFSASTKFSLLRGKDITANNYLINLPGDRVEGMLLYALKEFGKIQSLSLEGAVVYQFKQSRVPAGVDFAPPPDDYFLFNLQVLAEIPWKKRSVQLSLSAENILNKSYRNYLNRFRYFADEGGVNIVLRAIIPFGKLKK